MKQLIFRHVPFTMVFGFLLTGCIDSNYDLSDINTDASLSVNNLTLPVNIDRITLENILDLDSASKVKVVDNEYVFVSDGDFSSNDITIGQVRAEAPYIEPSKAMLPLMGSGATRTIKVPELSSAFSFTNSSVSSSIVDITEAKVEFNLRLTFVMPTLAGRGAALTLSNITVNLPKGWIPAENAGTYNATLSTLSISGVQGSDDHTVSVDVPIEKIVASDNLHYTAANHSITLSDKFGIAEASIIVTGASASSLPSQTAVTLDYMAGALTVTAFSGEINYEYSGLDVESISLTDLPSLLTQPGTNLKITNPQLYLKVENPLYAYSLKGRTGLTLTSVWPLAGSTVHTLDQGSFIIGSKQYNPYCLSPLRPASYYKGYESAEYVPFTSLSDVLSGDGLPSQIDIRLNDAAIYTQPVKMLPLGKNLGKVEGNYTIFAPLALNAGSTIFYTHTETGWNDDDVDAITISHLTVTANVESDLPADIHIVAYPLGKDGKIIPGTEIKGADISGITKGEPIEISLMGEIKHLDGIEIQAIATSSTPGVVLSPKQSITLTDIRATVTGKYTKKL